jgi:thiosulfate reductase/polysulfide reductase chain A
MHARAAAVSADRLAAIKGARVVRSFCYTCPWQCPSEMFVRDGRIVYQRGNPESPNNIGARCAKGMASSWIVEDPDRLRHPLIRTNPKGGPGSFRRASWDEALDLIARRLAEIAERWGPEAVVYMNHHSPNVPFAAAFFLDLYGTPNFSLGHSSGCEGDRRSAAWNIFGHIFPLHDFAACRYAMLWGINLLGANQALWESRGLLEAKQRGLKLVVVDPAFTETAQKADEWLPIRPGSDGALALAMARVIIDEGLHDAAFCSDHCVGFDHLRERGYSPAWAETLTGIETDRIVRLAREFATTKPAMAALFKGAGYYTNGHDASRAIYLLNAITGQVDGPGNLHLKPFAPISPPVTIPDAAKRKPARAAVGHALGYHVAPPCAARPSLPDFPHARLPDAVLRDAPYPIRGVFAHACNPVMSDPNRAAMQEAFRSVELAVAIELYMSETAIECDVVLPETSFYEQAEIRQGLWLGPQAILCQPCVPPVGESRPLYDIIKGLAQRMGWGEHFPYETWEDWARVAVKSLPVSLEELKERGLWSGEVSYGRPSKGLNTKSGKVEIFSNAYAAAGLNPYPEWRETAVAPDSEFPLRLTHSKLSMHCNIITQNNPRLMEICGENWVEINARDAARYAIADGADVWLESPKDRVRIRARVVEGLVPGAVSVRHGHGFGHWAMGKVAKGRGAHSNNLMDTWTNPATGTNSYNECKVRVRPA